MSYGKNEQFKRLREAVGRYHRLRKQLRKMEILSRKITFQEAPHPGRQKRLPGKVLGVN
jgi:hypothetical protein